MFGSELLQLIFDMAGQERCWPKTYEFLVHFLLGGLEAGKVLVLGVPQSIRCQYIGSPLNYIDRLSYVRL